MWRKLVTQWRSSGETAREFAFRHGVNPSTLSCWAWRLKREGVGDSEPRDPKALAHVPLMVEIRARPVAHADDRFEVEIAGRRVCVPPSFDVEALRRLIGVLEEEA